MVAMAVMAATAAQAETAPCQASAAPLGQGALAAMAEAVARARQGSQRENLAEMAWPACQGVPASTVKL
ncbi:hypothetical protein CCO03_08845 [Comamonas serinivorans]|uniref:Uncharacterized protein n=1 Tax=Comamonas serinivorans TaxID=1082851 RepID=A0A1Y0EMW0_9BURK|nr:hypothetical protein CCO03_08845 [Comamonas serinivorans]